MSDRDVIQTKESRSGPSAPARQESSDNGQSYLFRHAGIEEREGYIPVWLILVVASLILWSVYYTIRYWNES